MTGGTRSPYRPPCGYGATDPEIPFLGGPFQHYRITDEAIAELKNTTLVTDWNLPANPSGIPPYMRPNSAYTTCPAFGSPDGTGPFCGPWEEPVPVNTYAAYSPAQTVNLAACRKIGFKIIYARKSWHGCSGFDYSGDCCTQPLTLTGISEAFSPAVMITDGCCSQPANNTPPTTKYLTWTMTYKGTQGFADSGVSTTGDIGVYETYSGTRSYSVGRYTGLITQTACSDTSATFTYNDGTSSYDEVDGTDQYTDLILDALSVTGCIDSPLAFGNAAIAASGGAFGPVTDSYGSPLFGGTITRTATGYTYTASQYGTYVDTISTNKRINQPLVQASVTITLSDPYTSDDLNADVNALLATWSLADDKQYPYRTDLNCTSGPFVSYFETAFATPAQGWQACGFVDSNAAGGYDGSILGAPLTSGSDQYFDFRAQVYMPDPGGGPVPVIEGWGAYSPFPNATRWTNEIDAACLLPGRFASYGTLTNPFNGAGYGGGSLIKSKYAEIGLLGFPSHNFARPCGVKDLSTIDQTTVVCDGSGGWTSHGNLRWTGVPCFCNDPTQTTGCGTPDNPTAVNGWNDNRPKGDWGLITWTYDRRDIGENARLIAADPTTVCEADPSLTPLRPVTGALKDLAVSQQCFQFQTCCPAAVFLTDNGETAPNTQVFTGISLACDDVYGSQWQQMPQQVMVDPLWQQPVKPCCLDSSTLWREDDGSGSLPSVDPVTLNDIAYWPQRSYEEFRLDVPSGAPALPSGYYLGYLSVSALNAGSTAGNIAVAPSGGNCWMPVWFWAINRTGGGGEFNCEYGDPMAVCANDTTIQGNDAAPC